MTIRPPKSLGPAGRALFSALQKEYSITDVGGLTLLRMIAECRDTAVAAMAAIAKDGLYVVDRYKTPRANPACTILRDARNGELQALKQLHLDVEPVKGIGRPGGT